MDLYLIINELIKKEKLIIKKDEINFLVDKIIEKLEEKKQLDNVC